MKNEMNILYELQLMIESHEFVAFHRRITSLNSNLVYWNARLSDPKEAKEAKFEIDRCENLLRLVMKDMTKAKQKAEDAKN